MKLPPLPYASLGRGAQRGGVLAQRSLCSWGERTGSRPGRGAPAELPPTWLGSGSDSSGVARRARAPLLGRKSRAGRLVGGHSSSWGARLVAPPCRLRSASHWPPACRGGGAAGLQAVTPSAPAPEPRPFPPPRRLSSQSEESGPLARRLDGGLFCASPRLPSSDGRQAARAGGGGGRASAGHGRGCLARRLRRVRQGPQGLPPLRAPSREAGSPGRQEPRPDPQKGRLRAPFAG